MRAVPANYLHGYSSHLIGWYQRHLKINCTAEWRWMPTAVIRGYSSRTHLIGWHPRISAVETFKFWRQRGCVTLQCKTVHSDHQARSQSFFEGGF